MEYRRGRITREYSSSALPAHHGIDPDRGERRGATLRTGIVAIDSQLFSNGDGPLAVFGEVDSNFSQSAIHRPLHFGSGLPHFGFDAIQQRREVEPLGTLRDPIGGQSPSGAGSHWMFGGHPPLAK